MIKEIYDLPRKKEHFKVFHHWTGSISFKRSLVLQESFKPSAKKFELHFLGFESQDTVIAMGLRADSTHILWTKEKLKNHNISSVNIRRGGEATLHSPGQLVIYPVVCLPLLGMKVRDFIVMLENITQALLKDLDCQTVKEGKFAGLYTKTGKLCFFGIHISEGVSQHGLSINVDNDLSLFDSIKSCGQSHRNHDSLSHYLNASISKEDLFFRWCNKAMDFLKKHSSNKFYQL